MSDEEIPKELEPDLVEITDIHTRMSVATKLLMDLHSRLLAKSYRKRYRIERPERFRDLGDRLSKLTLDIIRIQDEVGEIVNEKVDELHGTEDEGTAT